MTARLLNLLLPAVGLSVLIGTLCYDLDRSEAAITGSSAQPTTKSAQNISPPTVRQDLREIAGWSLFGANSNPVDGAANPASGIAPASMSSKTGSIPEDLPTSSIDLHLAGVAFSDDQARAYAIVTQADGEQHEYRVAATLAPDVEVRAVRPREIVISNHGRLEILKLQEPTADSSASAAANLQSAGVMIPVPPAPAPPPPRTAKARKMPIKRYE